MIQVGFFATDVFGVELSPVFFGFAFGPFSGRNGLVVEVLYPVSLIPHYPNSPLISQHPTLDQKSRGGRTVVDRLALAPLARDAGTAREGAVVEHAEDSLAYGRGYEADWVERFAFGDGGG